MVWREHCKTLDRWKWGNDDQQVEELNSLKKKLNINMAARQSHTRAARTKVGIQGDYEGGNAREG